MRISKIEKLKALKNLFKRRKILMIDDISEVLNAKSRMTVHRYIQELDYLTSYSHKGQYYTLKEIAQFDIDGLWFHGDVGFSKYGTLFDTIIHFVNHAKAGMTSCEMRLRYHMTVKHALLDLVKGDKISRQKQVGTGTYVYLCSVDSKAKTQMENRTEMALSAGVDCATAFRVILMAYRLVEGCPSPERIADCLKKEGSAISLQIVRQVLHRYDLEKKTLGFTSSQF